MTVKCYVGNLDGTREGAVYATNQQAAAYVAGCSVYAFRQYWSARPMPGPIEAPRELNTLYSRLFGACHPGPWVKGRAPRTANDQAEARL
jgi:hypothetical protein